MPAAPEPSSHASPVTVTSGLPETVLPPEPDAAVVQLQRALSEPDAERRDAVADVVRAYPRSLASWAALGSLADDDVEAYAYFRVGYHRGLDASAGCGMAWFGHGALVRAVQPGVSPVRRRAPCRGGSDR